MGRCCYYVGKYEEGLQNCIQAYKMRKNDLDKFNMKFYTDKINEIKKTKSI